MPSDFRLCFELFVIYCNQVSPCFFRLALILDHILTVKFNPPKVAAPRLKMTLLELFKMVHFVASRASLVAGGPGT